MTEAAEITEIATYNVPEVNLGRLNERIAKLNKRAKKIGVAPVELAVEFDAIKFKYVQRDGSFEWYYQEAVDHLNISGKPTGEKMGFYTVTVSGESPKYDGWQFIATLETIVTDDGVAENLIKTVPGAQCPAEFAKRIGECDQCKLKRNRSETFVVKHESGEHKVVGRTCIGDFLGGVDPKSIVSQAEWMISIDEACQDSEMWDSDGCGGGVNGDVLEDLLKWAHSAIRTIGWTPKSACEFGGMSTAGAVLIGLHKHTSEPRSSTELREKIQPNDDDLVAAEAAIEWAKGFSDEEVENNNYLQNCRLVAKCAWCRHKNVGIAVSIVAAYLKHMDKLKRAEREAAKPESLHVGVIKKRQEFTVTCDKVIVIDGYYGQKGIHKMVDENGNDLVWFASGDPDNWLDTDCTYKVKATVKEHGEFNGRKQTVLARLAVIEEIDPETGKPIEKLVVEPESEVAREKVW